MGWLSLLRDYLPYLLSIITIYMTWMAGNKHPKAWAIGIFNQALWLTWIIGSGSWGFIPMNAAMWALYVRNHVKWQRS